MELIEKYWQLIVVAVSALVWMVRLEARANTNSRDIVSTSQKHTEEMRRLEERLMRQRAEDQATRERDWQRLLGELSEMRQDIKQLLKNGAR